MAKRINGKKLAKSGNTPELLKGWKAIGEYLGIGAGRASDAQRAVRRYDE